LLEGAPLIISGVFAVVLSWIRIRIRCLVAADGTAGAVSGGGAATGGAAGERGNGGSRGHAHHVPNLCPPCM